MKKILFLFVFTFIAQQAFSQIYIATLLIQGSSSTSGFYGCSDEGRALVGYGPTGNQTVTCIHDKVSNGGLQELTIALNSITSQGYKLIDTSYQNVDGKIRFEL